MKDIHETKIPKLTIGYATHNRKDCIVKRLRNLLSTSIPDYIEIIIIDNHSEDGTFEAISELSKNSKIRVYQNESNVGFAGNFCEVLKRARGDYVMWSSDEDEINFEGAVKLIEWMVNKKLNAVFLNHYRKESAGKLTPLRKNSTRRVRCYEVWECCHLSAIVWNRLSVTEKLNDITINKEKYPELSKYYPNLLLSISLSPFKKNYFYNGYITYQIDFEKSQHTSKKGAQYYHLNSRWLQHNELVDFIHSMILVEENLGRQKFLKKMVTSLNRNLYDYVSEAIRQENLYLYNYFSRSGTPFYVIRRWYKLLKLVIKSLFDNPLLALQRIQKRLLNRYVNNKL